MSRTGTRPTNDNVRRDFREKSLPAAYKFGIADDHPLFRGALRQALEGLGEDAEILEAGDFDTTKALVAANGDLDLLLLDLSMPAACPV